ncbi:MAG TPA: 4Fe-4S binding protein [Thermoclostridium sp.]|nr:4Fe-4S binding protein [Thermoclostridium sp.]
MKKIKVNLTFPPTMVTFPLMTLLVREYMLEVNILNADVRLNRTGKLVVELLGKEEDIDNALEFIQGEGIKCHIFNGTLSIEEDKCIHCGACTTVCPSHALQIEQPDFYLTFNKEKCLVCGLCIKACPLRILHLDHREIEE